MTYVADFGQTLQKISTYMNNNFHLKENLQKDYLTAFMYK